MDSHRPLIGSAGAQQFERMRVGGVFVFDDNRHRVKVSPYAYVIGDAGMRIDIRDVAIDWTSFYLVRDGE